MKTRLIKAILLTAGALAFLAGSAYVFYMSQKEELVQKFQTVSVTIHSQTFQIYVADTDDARRQGLMGVSYLLENYGMFLLYEDPRAITVWNKNVRIPLDILWIRAGKIIQIDFLAAEESRGIQYLYAPGPIDAVLELNAGTANKYGITAGDTIILKR